MDKSRESLIQYILDLSGEIFNMLIPGLPLEWLQADVTIIQLRVLLALHTDGPSRMSSIASAIGDALSTTTGIVDNLVKKGFVLRDADPQDRRVVICKLSPKGEELAGGLWTWGRRQIGKMLETQSIEQLQIAAGTTKFLLDNIKKREMQD